MSDYGENESIQSIHNECRSEARHYYTSESDVASDSENKDTTTTPTKRTKRSATADSPTSSPKCSPKKFKKMSTTNIQFAYLQKVLDF